MGLLDSIGGLLNNPTVQQLIPTVAGAAGAALTTPRGSGVRTQLGRALLGGAQGMMDAGTAKEVGLRSTYLQAQVDALHQATADRTTWNATAKGLLEKMNSDPNIPEADKIQFQTLAASPDTADHAKAANLYGSTMAAPLTDKVIMAHSTMTKDDLKGFTTDEKHKMGIKMMEAGLTPEYEKGSTIVGPGGHVLLSNFNKKDGTTKVTDTGVVDAKWKQAELLLHPKINEMEARTKLLNGLGITGPVFAKMQADAEKDATDQLKNRSVLSKLSTTFSGDYGAMKDSLVHDILAKKIAEMQGNASRAVGGGGLPEGAVEVDPD